MLLELFDDLLVEYGLLLLLDLGGLGFLGRSSALVALVHHRKDYAGHLPALERVVRSDHVQVRKCLLVQR